MKKYLNNIKQKSVIALVALTAAISFPSCEKNLDSVTYGALAGSNFFKTPADAQAAVSAMYTGMVYGWSGGFGAAGLWGGLSEISTDEGYCRGYLQLKLLTYNPDDGVTTGGYSMLMPYVSQITVNISKIEAMDFDATLKNRYVAELKALRALYSQLLYTMYGPVPIRLDATQINNTSAPVIPRPSSQDMVAQIIKDYTDAAAVLPDRFTGADYGRMSKAACLTGLLKLYMHEKRWSDAVVTGNQIKTMGFSLTPNYYDNFSVKAKGGNSEIILPIVCTAAGANDSYTNRWLDHALPANFVDQNGNSLVNYGSFFAMLWPAYNKFDPTDKRLAHLLRNYPVKKNPDGSFVYRDAMQDNPSVGAVPVKYIPEGSDISGDKYGLDIPVYRYADVELLMAEALDMQNNGPTADAYNFINDVRTTHGGLAPIPQGLNQADFLAKVQDERLFELWHEGVRRDDLVRWGLFIKAANAKGANLDLVKDTFRILYAIPRAVITQSGGVIKQNPGYN